MITTASTLQSFLRDASLCVIDGSGQRRIVGNDGPPVATLRIASKWTDLAIALRPSLAFGEAYMDGSLTVEDGTIYDVLAVLARNLRNVPRRSWFGATQRMARRIRQRNPVSRARQNVAHHYDLSTELYDLFLDRDWQYSCAYFSSPGMTLDAAQEAKKRHIASKLLLDRPGLTVLDIGSGWGGLGLDLARTTGAHVTGVTLSTQQHGISQARAKASGLDDRVQFHLRDYREQAGRFDRIVSVGMFEHVGKRNYGEFFAKINDLLTDDGVALLHSCGFSDEPSSINPFISKYIFPGADQPSLSEVFTAIEGSGLFATDVEVLRLHYAETLRCWRERFMARRDDAVRLYDERFCRMWEFYLALCEVGFRYLSSMVFQVQLSRRLSTVPITRDYILDAEHSLATKSHSVMAG